MRNRRQASRAWWLALFGSVVAHVAATGLLLVFGRGSVAPPLASGDDSTPAVLAISIAPVDLPDERLGPELGDPPLPTPLTLPNPRPWDAPEGDRDNPVPVTVAPSQSDAHRRRAPAFDQGETGGAPPANAFRMDRSTLHSRLSDGARAFQPAHAITARHAASPQAERRERTAGIGDSVRTTVPTRPPEPAPAASPAVALSQDPAAPPPEHAAAEPSAAAPAAPPLDAPPAASRVAVRPDPTRGSGPLDAERGARAYDVQARGRAEDDQRLRAASNEGHPGLTDFTRPAAPSAFPSADGRGPGERPGAIDRVSAGIAPAALGAPNARAQGTDVDARTLDRRYDRYKQEIRQRVNNVLEFPKPLALKLEQGETVVYFVVGIDGRLGEGPRVVKSSGFEEFDTAALRAVRRAAPFPPMNDPRTARPLQVSMPVTFDNPVIR